VQRDVADDAAGGNASSIFGIINAAPTNRSSLQCNIVFDNGQQALHHDSRRNPDLRLTVIGGLPAHGVLRRFCCARHVIHRKV